MVTAASSADAAVVLVDAIKLDWKNPALELLPQTRRHALLVNLLRVPSIVFAINKLDAVDDPSLAFVNISKALRQFAEQAQITITALVPISALKGFNVVDAAEQGWCGYTGPHLLDILEALPTTPADEHLAFSFPVQWVEKFHDSNITTQGRRVFWGRVGTGTVSVGQTVRVFPSGQTAVVAQVLSATRQSLTSISGHSAGIVLDKEVDVSRGDWLLAGDNALQAQSEIETTVAWMDDEPLVAGRVYWALHGHRWVKAKVQRVVHRLNVNTLEEEIANELPPNAIGHVTLALQQPLVTLPFTQSRVLGALVLVDTASHKTSAAVLVR
jgi:sulfate adenylyltransferase subunit 1